MTEDERKVRQQVLLTKRQKAMLKDSSRESGLSICELVRHAVDEYFDVNTERPPKVLWCKENHNADMRD